MLSQDSLRWVAETLDLGAPVLWLDQTTSTNAEALELAETGAPEMAAVVAGHQTAGRGRLGRTWLAPAGSSLLISVVLRPEVAAEEVPMVSLHAAACMAEACRSAFGLDVGIKWPNDLMVGERKLAGVLPEARVTRGVVDHVVVGIGVNLRQGAEDFPPDARGRATSVELEGVAVSDGAERDLVLAYLRGLAEARAGRPGWQDPALDALRELCLTLGRDVRATTVDGRDVVGRAVDLDGRGGLVIEAEGRRQAVAFGEVHHLR